MASLSKDSPSPSVPEPKLKHFSMAGSPSRGIDGGSGGDEVDYGSENDTGVETNSKSHADDDTGGGSKDSSNVNGTMPSLWEKRLQLALEGINDNGEATPKAMYHFNTYCENKKLMEEAAALRDKHEKLKGKNPVADAITQDELDRLRDLFEKGETREDRKKTRYDEGLRLRSLLYRLLLGAFIAYALLGIYIWTIVNFAKEKCEGFLAVDEATAKELWTILLKQELWTLPEFDENNIDEGFQRWMENCRSLYTGPMEIIHNVTFGLITAVVVAEIGSGGTSKDKLGGSVYDRFKPIRNDYRKYLNERMYDLELQPSSFKKKAAMIGHIEARSMLAVSGFIINYSPWIVVFVWTVCGIFCLVKGWKDQYSPLYTTGQTWLGVCVTTTYLYFGVTEEKDKCKDKCENDERGNAKDDESEEVADNKLKASMKLQMEDAV